MREKYFLVFGSGVFGAILYLFWNDLSRVISHSQVIYFPIILLVYFGSLILWALRWGMYLNERVKLGDLLKFVIIGNCINNLTPFARLGGEPVRAYLLKKKYAIPFSDALAKSIAELVPEFISQMIFVLSVLSIYLIFSQPPEWLLLSSLLFIFLYILAGLVFVNILDSRKMKKLFEFLSRKSWRFSIRRSRIAPKFFKFQYLLRNSFSDKKLFIKTLSISIVLKLLEMIRIFFVFLFLGNKESILTIAIIVSLTLILSTLPLTPGSIGVMEGGLISFLLIMGIDKGVASAFVIIDRTITFWIPIILGFVLISRYGIAMDLVKKLRR